MKKIIIYYGSKSGFERLLPPDIKTLSQFIGEDDAKRKQIVVTYKTDSVAMDKDESKDPDKNFITNLVAFSESYAGITESAIQSFISIISGYEIENLFLQNPPIQIKQQLEQAYANIITIQKCEYKTLSKSMFEKINNNFSERIIGQENVKERLLISLYPLLTKSNKNKPIVLMFYGASGVGKTETAKFISEILGQSLFRKQFSMFHSSEFSNYLFGGNHFQSCFSRDLLERESNVILLDEFDKPNPIFHSAFYQLFDEGIFEDKNYRVDLYNAIIICTSNYSSESEIRKYLGDPIFFRFDKFIKFENLSINAIKKIIEKTINKKYNTLNKYDKKNVDIEYIKNVMCSYSSNLSNVRQITTIVEEFFGIQLVKNFFKN